MESGSGHGREQLTSGRPQDSIIIVPRAQETWWNLAVAMGENSLQLADRRTLQHGVDAIRSENPTTAGLYRKKRLCSINLKKIVVK